jgi:hypothetical protein
LVVAQKQVGESAAQFRSVVGRIGEDQVVGLSGAGMPEKIENILGSHATAQSGLREIAFNRGDGGAVVLQTGQRAALRASIPRAPPGKQIEIERR